MRFNKKTAFFFIFCLYYNVSVAQWTEKIDAVWELYYTHNPKKIINAKDLCKNIIFSLEKTNNKKDLSGAYNLMGAILMELKENAAALSYYQKAVDLRKEVFGVRANEVANCYMNLGLLYEKNIQYLEANTYFHQAFDIYNNNKNYEKLQECSRYWANISRKSTIDSTNYIYQQLLFSHFSIDDGVFAFVKECQAKRYEDNQDFDKAIETYQQALSYTKANLLSKSEFLYHISYNFLQKGDTTQCHKYLFNAKDLLENNRFFSLEKKELLALIYTEMGDIYTHNLQIALEWYKKAEKNTNDEAIKAQIWYKMSYVYALARDYAKALYFVEKSLHIDWGNKTNTYQKLNLVGKIHENRQEYDKALNYYHFALQVLEKGLLFSENKTYTSEILQTEMDIARVWCLIGKKDKSELAFKQSIAYATHAQTLLPSVLSKIGSKNSKIEVRNRYRNIFYSLFQSFRYLGQQEEAFKAIQALKNNDEWVDVPSKLQNKQTYLSFFCSEDSIYVFIFNKNNTMQLKVLGTTTAVTSAIYQLLPALALPKQPELFNRMERQQNVKCIVEKSVLCYRNLINPIANLLQENLIIEPDAELCFLPFEVLIAKTSDDNEDFRQHDYLLKHHTINYVYNAKMLLKQADKWSWRLSKKVLAVAPDFKRNQQGFDSLRNNVSEVMELEKSWAADIAIKKHATKANFIKLSSNYDILHLSTHGLMYPENADSSFVAFVDEKQRIEKLNVAAINQMTLNADLVTLSACQTASGRVYYGEGMMSIGKAFLAAGAHNFVASIWNADDAYSFELMKNFYEILKQEKSVDVALRKAKLSCLENDKAHPYYWAGFIVLGDGNKIAASFLPILLLSAISIFAAMIAFKKNALRSILYNVRNRFWQQ